MMQKSNQLRHLLLLRHGQTDSNAGGTIQGHLPVPLNAIGHAQAERLARRLRQFRPQVNALISSDLRRAAQTAEAVAREVNLPVRYDSAWRERGLGELEGKTVGDVEIWRAASGETTPPGAESSADFQQRVLRVFQSVSDQCREAQAVAVVTHGGPIRVILKLMQEGLIPLAQGQARPELLMIGNCSIMHLIGDERQGERRWEIACLNDVAHLEDLETAADAG